MAYTTINGRNSVADLTIATKSYKCIISTMGVDCVTDQIPASTFCSEPNEEFEAGNTTLLLTIAGLLKKGIGPGGSDAPGGPLIPPPQKVAVVVTFDANCTIGFTANFRRATASRTANQNSVMTGEAFSTGAIAVAWVIA